MTKLFFTCLTALSCIVLNANTIGAPELIKYQVVIRNSTSELLVNQSVGIRMTFLQGSANGTNVYQETFSVSTNAYGLVNLDLGSGTPVSGTFATIDWSNSPYFVETAVDITGGTSYVVMGASQLMSVPYALYAKTALNAVNDSVNDADADSTNELQSLSITDNQLSISDGNTIALPESPWTRSGNMIHTETTDSVAIGTITPLSHLHIMGSTTSARLLLTPNEPFSGDDAEINLSEDDDNTYNATIKYDGGDNRLYVYGKNNANLNGPHLGINRDNGRVGIGTGTVNPVSELEVVGTVTATAFTNGDASGLTNVHADLLRGSMQADTNDILQWNGNSWAAIPYHRYAFHASASTDQTVPVTGYDTLRCDNSSSSENFEYPAGVYDNSTYAFVAPVDGIYFFEASALWENVDDGLRCAIFIRVNDTDEVGSWNQASLSADFFSTNVSTTLELNKNDEVRIRVYNGDAVPRDTFSQFGKYCYFSGYLVFAK